MDHENWKKEEDQVVLDRMSIFEIGKPNTFREDVNPDFMVLTELGSFYQVDRADQEGYDLVLFNGEEEITVLHDICVLASNKRQQFMLIYEKMIGYIYLIDTRGILYLYDSIDEDLTFTPGQFLIKYKRENNLFEIDAQQYGVWRVLVLRPKLSLLEKQDEEEELKINEEFVDFFNEEDEEQYLYLSYQNLKMKKVISYLLNQNEIHEESRYKERDKIEEKIDKSEYNDDNRKKDKKQKKEAEKEKGIEYEIVPNLLESDEKSFNIRIPLNEENLLLPEVQFLVARYKNAYSIMEVPYEYFIGNMDLDPVQMRMYKNLHLSKGSEKISKEVCRLLKLIRAVTDCRLDSILFHEYFKNIAERMEVEHKISTNNVYQKLIIPYPGNFLAKEENKSILMEYVDYMDDLKLPYTEEGIEGMNGKEAYKACIEAHRKSLANYRDVMSFYEEKFLDKKRMY